MSLHPWAKRTLEIRGGGEITERTIPVSIRGTSNQRKGSRTNDLTACHYAPPTHPLGDREAADEAAEAYRQILESERLGGLYGGEGHANYGLQHGLAEAMAVTELLALQDRYPENERIQKTLDHAAAQWRTVVSFALAWRTRDGVVEGVGDRWKAVSVRQTGGEDARGWDIVAEAFAPLGGALHPQLRHKLYGVSLDSPHYTVDRQSHRALILELRPGSPAYEYLCPRVPPAVPPVYGRLQEGTHWRQEPDGLVVLAETLVANPDSDKKTKEVESYWRFTPPATYRLVTERREIQKGVTAQWEFRERDDTRVFMRGLQGVRQGALLPHPEGAKATGPGWSYAGPESAPYPIDALPGPTPEPDPEPDPDPEPEPDRPTPEEVVRAQEIIKEVQQSMRSRTGKITWNTASAWARRLHDALVALRGRP